MFFLFHSPLHVLLPVTHTRDDRATPRPKSTDILRRFLVTVTFRSPSAVLTEKEVWIVGVEGFLEGRTRCGGMVSPKVRVSLAILLRRLSAGVGKTGESGEIGDGDTGPGESVAAVEGVDGDEEDDAVE